MVIVLDEGKLCAAETAKVVDSGERALPKHVLGEDPACEREGVQNAYCDYDASSPIDEVELGQSIEQLDDKYFFPYDGGKAVCLPSHRFPETRNHERMVRGFEVRRTAV